MIFNSSSLYSALLSCVVYRLPSRQQNATLAFSFPRSLLDACALTLCTSLRCSVPEHSCCFCSFLNAGGGAGHEGREASLAGLGHISGCCRCQAGGTKNNSSLLVCCSTFLSYSACFIIPALFYLSLVETRVFECNNLYFVLGLLLCEALASFIWLFGRAPLIGCVFAHSAQCTRRS